MCQISTLETHLQKLVCRYEILPILRFVSGGVSILLASQRITSACSIHPHPNSLGILEISDKLGDVLSDNLYYLTGSVV